ncbi:MAG: D-tyrosyl-tRNA(Tyr) deacylase [Lentisphaerae bacterium]|jgi:D-tyrosyl-tRNA(Tyr) deacylase|nr:D-aminoacyl-tRNA deacylase [Victivallaceae bacterium]MDD3116601.1 D-aminoacyl-tRNA deacylase [Victivallaceae bacterium]MDD3703451.1 D-aminoacyl-tRNA deacylase [Victivallaceae bacterium]NLK84175.1 D-tyrosyl-tRNA(Tyr) deacylase [Lentisphaerota bacterium]
MRVLIQRVRAGSVTINGLEKLSIEQGLVILLGITHTDSIGDVDYLVEKTINLRVFEDDGGKMNLALRDVGGDVLIVSQFTLYGNCVKGRRPGFDAAASPEHAIPLYEKFIEKFKQNGINTVTGEFGAKMLVDIQNDGPVTIMLESAQGKPVK